MTPQQLPIPTVSVKSTVPELADAISTAKDGLLIVTDLPFAPFGEINATFDYLSESPTGRRVGERLNSAYPQNLVYKDSFASGNGGASVDMKRVLDLSPERLNQVRLADPDLYEEHIPNDDDGLAPLTTPLGETLKFWKRLQDREAQKILSAVAAATGCPADVLADASMNYRMVDYYEREASQVPPRCGEHRDFGTFTLVFTTDAGLQFCGADGNWRDVPVPKEGSRSSSAVLLFGWCTQIRSNGRIPAALHRVVDAKPSSGAGGGVVPRRTSAVLFVAPKRAETTLEPVVCFGEERAYVGGVKVGQLRGSMARKWRHREGTLSELDKIKEEDEIRATKMVTQDDVVARTVSAN